MEYVASYMLLVQNNMEATAENISKLLKSISAPVDQDTLKDFMSKVEGKSYEEIISAGASMMTLQSVASSAPAAGSNTVAAQDEKEDKEDGDSSSGVDLDIF